MAAEPIVGVAARANECIVPGAAIGRSEVLIVFGIDPEHGDTSRFPESRIHGFQAFSLTWHAGMLDRIAPGPACEVDCSDHAVRIFGRHGRRDEAAYRLPDDDDSMRVDVGLPPRVFEYGELFGASCIDHRCIVLLTALAAIFRIELRAELTVADARRLEYGEASFHEKGSLPGIAEAGRRAAIR